MNVLGELGTVQASNEGTLNGEGKPCSGVIRPHVFSLAVL